MDVIALRKASIGYLLLPNIIFCFGWFRQPYPLILVAGYLFLWARELIKKEKGEAFLCTELFYLLCFALIWTLFSGVGGFSQQTSDFWAHNAKYYDLYKNPWPNYFPVIDRYSCYYFGYFLVPALLSKLAGTLLPSALVIWSVIGYFLAVCWIYIFVRRNKLLLFSFLWIRGIGHVILFSLKKSLFITSPFYLPVLRAMFEQSGWVPNQLIPVIIATCILLYDSLERDKVDDTFFVLTLTFIWAIFPSICLILIYSIPFLKKYLAPGRFKELLTSTAICKYWLPGFLIFPSLIYLLSSQNTPLHGSLWQFDPSFSMTAFYLVGFFIDWLLFFYTLTYLQKKAGWVPQWFIYPLFLLLFLISLFRIGINNDSFYRGQIPFFIIIIVGILNGAQFMIKEIIIPKSRLFLTAIIPLILAAVIQLGFSSQILKNNILVKNIFPNTTDFQPIPYKKFDNVYEALKYLHGNKGDAEQYLGKKGSLYDKYLARDKK